MIELFYEVRAIANIYGWLSGEYFSVDGTLIQATAEHKILEHRDGSDDDGANIKGKTHCNGKHASTTKRDARLYRKYKTASDLRFMGHTLGDNRQGLMASAMVTTAGDDAEREAAKAVINEARQAPGDWPTTLTLGADNGYDAQEFIEALHEMNVTPHVAPPHLRA